MLTNNKNKKFRRFSKNKFVDFQNFQKSNFDGGKFLENLIIHKPSLGSRDVPQKIWASDRQAKFIYRLQIAMMFTGIAKFYNLLIKSYF